MTGVERFRLKAEECEQTAAKVKDDRAKRLLSRAAKQWRDLASYAEKWDAEAAVFEDLVARYQNENDMRRRGSTPQRRREGSGRPAGD